MNTKLVDGKMYEVKEIAGHGTCLVPTKDPIDCINDILINSGLSAESINKINTKYRLNTGGGKSGTPLVPFIVSCGYNKPMSIGLLWEGYTHMPNAHVNWITFGLHDKVGSFILNLRDYGVEVEEV